MSSIIDSASLQASSIGKVMSLLSLVGHSKRAKGSRSSIEVSMVSSSRILVSFMVRRRTTCVWLAVDTCVPESLRNPVTMRC